MYAQGILTESDGVKYIGEFRDGRFYDQCILGKIKNGNMHGQGMVTDSNGAKYVSEFKDNKMHNQRASTSRRSNINRGGIGVLGKTLIFSGALLRGLLKSSNKRKKR